MRCGYINKSTNKSSQNGTDYCANQSQSILSTQLTVKNLKVKYFADNLIQTFTVR